jgi:thiamine-phosphate pyrophosphorylase
MSTDHAAAKRGKLAAARFYGILDSAYVTADRWKSVCSSLIEGGADLIQVRAKGTSATERERLLFDLLPLFELDSQQPPFLVINDDVELCARVPGLGLHVGQDDTPVREARERIGTDRLLGLSTHSPEQAQAAMDLPAGTLDYFCTGPVFATQTKPDYEPVGLELVRWTAARNPELPWFCIGGINRATLAEVLQAGANRVVVVSDVLLDKDPAAAVRALKHQL